MQNVSTSKEEIWHSGLQSASGSTDGDRAVIVSRSVLWSAHLHAL